MSTIGFETLESLYYIVLKTRSGVSSKKLSDGYYKTFGVIDQYEFTEYVPVGYLKPQ